MTRLLPQPFVSLAILGLWLALSAKIGAGQILLGSALGIAIPLITQRFWPDRPRLAKPVSAFKLFMRVVGDIVAANLQVARLVLGPVARLRPTLVEVPIDIEDRLAATILGSIISLTPGTVSIDIDFERSYILVHALDVADQAALIATIKSRYETPLKDIFQC
jgi:multicomponent K+:H+ antiporter subunit E